MSNIVPVNELKEMALALGKNKLFGKSPEELLPLMLIAQAEGLHPAIAAQEYDVIQGRPAINSRSALARFQKAGGRIKWGERSDIKCSAIFSHAQGGDVEIIWTIERAQKANLTAKDNWKKFPAQMLSARVISEGVRSCFPACLSGMYTTEEVQDTPAAQVVTTKEIVDGKIIEVQTEEHLHQDEATLATINDATSIEGLSAAWAKIPVGLRHAYKDAKDAAKEKIAKGANNA